MNANEKALAALRATNYTASNDSHNAKMVREAIAALESAPVASGVDLPGLDVAIDRAVQELANNPVPPSVLARQNTINVFRKHLATLVTPEPAGQAGKVCANCKEDHSPCACERNLCIRCGGPVGNITFTVCDKCWDLDAISQHVETVGENVIRDMESADKLIRLESDRPQWVNMAEAMELIQKSIKVLRTQPQGSAPS